MVTTLFERGIVESFLFGVMGNLLPSVMARKKGHDFSRKMILRKYAFCVCFFLSHNPREFLGVRGEQFNNDELFCSFVVFPSLENF